MHSQNQIERKPVRTLLFLLLTSLMIPALEARQAYVIDDLSIHVRSGPTDGFRIVFYVKAGATLTLIGDEQNGRQKIKDNRGREGWIETKWLTRKQGAKDRLAEALAKIERLNKQHKDKVKSLEEQLAISEKTASKSREYRKKATKLEGDIKIIETKNQNLSRSFWSDAMFSGAIILFFGGLVGLIFGRMSRKRKSQWN